MNDLEGILNRIKSMEHNGVPGVVLIQGNEPGPVLGITACTHGNEPSGLAVFQYLLDEFKLRQKLLKGSVYLVLNNIKAAENNFKASTTEERVRARFVDVNMNRLPDDLLKNNSHSSYEVLRTKELLPIFQEFEFGLDIHSTTQDSDPMIINLNGSLRTDLVRGFPIQLVISNIDTVQIGKPVSSFYGATTNPASVLVIESGTHESPRSFKIAIDSTLALLQNLNMIEPVKEVTTHEHVEYYIDDSLIFPNKTFTLNKPLKNFEYLPAQTLIASGDTGPVFTPFDCHVVFCPQGVIPNSYDEEVLFYSRPVKSFSL